MKYARGKNPNSHKHMNNLGVYAQKGRPAWNKGKKWPLEQREKLSNTKKKQFSDKTKHPRWKGGISRDIHGGKENIEWRSKVFQRDNWTCQTCHIRGVYLEAHHIKSWVKYPELRYVLENGVTLCKDCHKLTDNYKGKANKKL